MEGSGEFDLVVGVDVVGTLYGTGRDGSVPLVVEAEPRERNLLERGRYGGMTETNV